MGHHTHGPEPHAPMDHGHGHHGHGHSTGPVDLPRSRATVAVLATLVVAAVAVLATIVLTWPQHRHHDIPFQYRDEHGHAVHAESASVRSVVLTNCANPLVSEVLRDPPQVSLQPSGMCFDATAVLTSGPTRAATCSSRSRRTG